MAPLWTCGHLGCVCVEFEGKVVAFDGSQELQMANNIFSMVGTQPAPDGAPWETLAQFRKFVQMTKSMGKRKAVKFPWNVSRLRCAFLTSVLTSCQSLRPSAGDALVHAYLHPVTKE